MKIIPVAVRSFEPPRASLLADVNLKTYIDRWKRLLLEEKLSPKVTDEVCGRQLHLKKVFCEITVQ